MASPKMGMACSECERLQESYKHLKTIWEGALSARVESLAYTLQADYRRLTACANEAWLDAERARLEFENHRKTHGE
jgi:hypothetical protein